MHFLPEYDLKEKNRATFPKQVKKYTRTGWESNFAILGDIVRHLNVVKIN